MDVFSDKTQLASNGYDRIETISETDDVGYLDRAADTPVRNGYNNVNNEENGSQSNRQSIGLTPSSETTGGNSVQCPTCRGVGFVAKEHESQLVALIPLKDKRLKPRRTWLYVLCAVGFSLVAASLVIFFMFPRDVTLSSNLKLLLPSNLTINTTAKYVNFYVNDVFNVSNSNYFSISLISYTLSVIFDSKVLNTTSVNLKKNVPLRDWKSFDTQVGITFDKENGFSEMVNVCSLPITFLHERYMFFQVSLMYNFLGRKEEASFETTPLVSCGYNNAAENR